MISACEGRNPALDEEFQASGVLMSTDICEI